MKKNNQLIHKNYSLFHKLLHKKKIISDSKIVLSDKKNNTRFKVGQTDIIQGADHPTILIVESSKIDGKYGIKLRCESLTKEPFIRFDSDGPAHRNDDFSIDLEDQMVSTPHFNTFDQNGLYIAYKNDTLKDEKKSNVIVKDINFGVSLFCMETSCSLNDGNFPEIVDPSTPIPFNIDNGLNISNLNFD
jgi:hypothetical protein